MSVHTFTLCRIRIIVKHTLGRRLRQREKTERESKQKRKKRNKDRKTSKRTESEGGIEKKLRIIVGEIKKKEKIKA